MVLQWVYVGFYLGAIVTVALLDALTSYKLTDGKCPILSHDTLRGGKRFQLCLAFEIVSCCFKTFLFVC